MNYIRCIIVFLFTIAFAAHSYAKKADDQSFEKLFADWTYAFNHKDLNASCQLFSVTVKANYQGVPPRSYQSICKGFKKIFNDSKRTYQYRFKLHDVYCEGDLATLRITWYLTVTEKGKITHIQDEGIDILKKNKNGGWKIVNYLAYPAK